MTDLQVLQQHLQGMGRVMLGYSGGVDSALLAVAGRRALGSEHFLAVIGRSASYPEVQWRTAIEVARRFDVPLLELETRELDDPRYLRNAPDRCYFCKSELWTRVRELAGTRGFVTVIDGTNVDDLGEHRPGLAAGSERGVRSPLAELGWSKAQVRAASLQLGLPTWDAPAAPCLSSRIRYGLEITAERLRQVEQGEAFLRASGVTGDLRVRHLGVDARVEVPQEHLDKVRDKWDEVQRYFERLGFASVELDPDGYRRGRMLSLLSAPTV